MITWWNLLLPLFLLICRDTVLLTHNHTLASIREIDNGHILIGSLLLLALAVSANTGVELSTF